MKREVRQVERIILIFGAAMVLLFSLFAGAQFLRPLVKSSAAANPVADLSENAALSDGSECSEGWRITGYFTPVETDYASPEMSQVEIAEGGKYSFNQEFLETVFDEEQGFGEGWGKTRFGWYLGNYDGRWHKSAAPLDAHNTPLKVNSVAVDNVFIPNESLVSIPGLPGDFGTRRFVANDVGVTVHGKHIDVYTGEGKDAEREMYNVTFEDDVLQKVCFQKPKSK